jgi:hypothetical protein
MSDADEVDIRELERRFDAAMFDVYRRAKHEAGYNATRFLQMLDDLRGVQAARTLLAASKLSEGYVALWERGRLDLTVEAVILDPAWEPLFTDEQRRIARSRLTEYGFKPSPPARR